MQHQQVQGGRRKYRSGEFGRGEFRGRYFEGSVNGEEEEERSEYSFYEEGGRGQHGVIIHHHLSSRPLPFSIRLIWISVAVAFSIAYGVWVLPGVSSSGPTPPPVIVPFDEFEEKVKVETRESFVTWMEGRRLRG
ncbi:hypothetical protein BC829DRAFT_422722 [Chytridium lagenaria]|nr:hypothetical protein BC829DRAFT_422722 [Chytridium lagenaria]